MEQKYEGGFKMLAMMHLNDLQTQVFLFSILIIVLKNTRWTCFIQKYSFGLDHLATLCEQHVEHGYVAQALGKIAVYD